MATVSVSFSIFICMNKSKWMLEATLGTEVRYQTHIVSNSKYSSQRKKLSGVSIERCHPTLQPLCCWMLDDLTSGWTHLILWHTKPSLQWKRSAIFLPCLFLVFCVNNVQQSIASVLEEEKDRDADSGSSAFPDTVALVPIWRAQEARWRWHILLSKPDETVSTLWCSAIT